MNNSPTSPTPFPSIRRFLPCFCRFLSFKHFERPVPEHAFRSVPIGLLTLGMAKGGSLRTIEYAHGHGKPYLAINIDKTGRKYAVEQIASWLNGEDPDGPKPPRDCVLNVAGNRESGADGIHNLTEAIMVDVLRGVNPECAKVYPLQA